MEKEKKIHYVDNKLFFAEMEKWKTDIAESDEVDDLPPKVTEYMGECFYKIATHLSYRPKIIYYAFIRRITKEKKQTAIKQKIIDNTATKTYDVMEGDNDIYSNTYMEFLRDNLDEKEVPKPKRKRSKKGIEHFIEEELNENEI